ncbi:MAG: hypothetical protein AB7V18_19580 [Pyrinomonadaceae bacterium]
MTGWGMWWLQNIGLILMWLSVIIGIKGAHERAASLAQFLVDVGHLPDWLAERRMRVSKMSSWASVMAVTMLTILAIAGYAHSVIQYKELESIREMLKEPSNQVPQYTPFEAVGTEG